MSPPQNKAPLAVPEDDIEDAERRLSLANGVVASQEAIVAKQAALGLDTTAAADVLRGLQKNVKVLRSDLVRLLGKLPDRKP